MSSINTNVAAMTALQTLTQTNKELTEAQNRISTGLRVAGAEDNAACDSSPGAGDGRCDACPITSGQTTENEMFVLSPSIVRP